MKRQAHLVGSVGLTDSRAVFETVSDILGDSCARLPDGETGARGYWIRWQQQTFDRSPDLEMELQDVRLPGFNDTIQRPFYRIRDGVDPKSIDLGEFGYAAEAIASYEVFKGLVAEGRIADGTRFQISIPTPVALVCGFVIPSAQLDVEPALEAGILRDVRRIQDEIPADQLCIQFDVCYEIVGADGGISLPYPDLIEGSLRRVVGLCNAVESAVELGIHLCYGDPGHQHIVEPRDLGTSVAFANGIAAGSNRNIDYVHIAVPRERSDEPYFQPLKALKRPSTTKLILGLVHYTDGVEGGRKRMHAADRYITDYDIATECGFGRRDPATIPDLLRIHRELCE